jgi:outer membrane protein OmpA-like peptidoglycan-associated protein
MGDGLRGEYYSGLNFEHFVRARHDAAIDFSWNHEAPMPGVPAEQFTVRWTGWLVPPVTGHYVLHLAVDDGARLWLNGKLLLDEWRGQPLGYYDIPVELRAGRPYRLRLDYCQYSLDTRALLIWERPKKTEVLSEKTWRNLWGATDELPTFASRFQETIPTRYLFSKVPPPPRLAADLASVVVVATKPLALTTPAPVIGASRPAPAKPRLATTPPVTHHLPRRARAAPAGAANRYADTLAAQLLRGRALTLRTLYFEQGQADLLASVQASLDTLARVLKRYPSISLEVQGHTDNQGNPVINQQLSQRRAEAVCQYLSTQGVAPGRLQPVGLGGTQPLADNNVPAQRPRNRRVVLRPLPQ